MKNAFDLNGVLNVLAIEHILEILMWRIFTLTVTFAALAAAGAGPWNRFNCFQWAFGQHK